MESALTVEELREKVILEIERAENKESKKKSLADNLMPLGLTMYSDNFSFDSIVYNAFAISELDDNISLHPDQLLALDVFEENEGVIFSAPTSFGKTFVVFEHIARKLPKNVVLIVPTLALVDEYKKNIIKKYRKVFERYKVYSSLNEEHSYDFDDYNIFILTHDRVVDRVNYSILKRIDLLVIDEVYKLKRNEDDDRVLVLNLAYHFLVDIANKHILLAPFIGGVKDLESLEKTPYFLRSNFSPVVNEVVTYNIEDNNEAARIKMTGEILKTMGVRDKKMLYFPTVSSIYSYINNLPQESRYKVEQPKIIKDILKWMRTEIHEKWYLVKALENGLLVHNGQLSIGMRMFQLDMYNSENEHNTLLCTSTLLEGVNTTAKHIIITKPSRSGRDTFDAFDFYNLVGRSGRLLQHYLGTAHYVKGPNDPEFLKSDAVKNIEFEITGDSTDIDIQLDNIEKIEANESYQNFLKELNITHEEYKEHIGAKYRFKTVVKLYEDYLSKRAQLIRELEALRRDDRRGRLYIVKILFKIFEDDNTSWRPSLINSLLNKRRPSVKTVVNDTLKYFKTLPLDLLITTTIKYKSSYIEHSYYSKSLLIGYFLEKNGQSEVLIQTLEEKIKVPIDFLYFNNSKTRKTLKDMGIYEKDIEKVVKVIGDEYRDSFSLRAAILLNKGKFKNISVISRYVINALN